MSILHLFTLLVAAAPPAPADTLVVCPAALRSALAPWVEYRTSQGHTIELVPGELSAAQLQAEIRRRARRGALAYVLLVGDEMPRGSTDKSLRGRTVPAWQAVAKVIPRYGGEATIATDNGYADLDDDAVPDVAVGRLTADTPAQLALMVDKILAYERSVDFGLWRRQVNLLAGIGGFGPVADAAIEAAARRVLAEGIPPEYALRITYGNWRSPYCPDPQRFRQTAIDSLGENGLFWIYLGHAWPGRLADLQVPTGAFRSLDQADLKHVHAAAPPIACLLACYTGAFDAERDCLAEVMLATPGGPVAVICGSRVTMPYAMAVLGTQLLTEVFENRSDTLGQALLAAKRQMVRPGEKSPTREGLDALAALLNPGALDEELSEHLHLFNLLGDPLLSLRLPEPMAVSCPAECNAGDELVIDARTSAAGRATVELIPRRDRLGFRPPQRLASTPPAEASAEFDATYRRANDPVLARVEFDVEPGPFTCRLRVPPDVHGPCHARVFIAGRKSHAAGSADVEIKTRPPQAD